jgi:hypothetical protein
VITLPDYELVATHTLGRISSAYLSGRVYAGVWSGPLIAYPRPIAERTSGIAPNLGLHTTCDKWVADYPWYLRLGIKDGAFPYKITLTGEAIDGLPGSVGLAYASYIEDHSAATPYMGLLKETGWTAPSGGTKVIAFTVNVEDCLGETDSVDVSLTIYAQNHANIRDNFRICDFQAAGGGDGSPATPYNTWAGLWGTNLNSAIECPYQCIAIFKGTGTVTASALLNQPAGENAWWIGGTLRPRQIVALHGSTVDYDGAAFAGVRIIAASADVLVQNILFRDRTGTAQYGIYIQNARDRSSFVGLTADNWEITDNGANTAFIAGNVSSALYVCILDLDLIDAFASSYHVNASAAWVLLDSVHALVDNVTATNLTKGNGVKFAYLGRTKHASTYIEFRRINKVTTGQHCQEGVLALTTGGGTNDQIKAVIRYCNIADSTVGGNGVISVKNNNTGATLDDEVTSVMVLFNSLRGTVTLNTDRDAAIEGDGQLWYYRNLVQNANAGTNSGILSLDADWIPVTGKPQTVEDNVAATSGLIDASGAPVSSSHLGQYGHTVITV